MISFIFYRRPPPLKSVTMATRNALFPIFKFQTFTHTYLGKVTKFQFNCFSRLGAAFKKPEAGGISPIRVKIGVGCWALGFSGTCVAGLPKTQWPPSDSV